MSDPSLKFPKIGLAEKNEVQRLLDKKIMRLKKYQHGYIMGWAGSYPHPVAEMAYNKITHFNPNNIMIHSWESEPEVLEKERSMFRGTQEMEREVIFMLADLMRAEDPFKNISGYITSGGTEANITGLWLIRNEWLQKDPDNKITDMKLLIPISAHYSIAKACNLLGLSKTNMKNWEEEGYEKGMIEFINLDENYKVDLTHMKEVLDKEAKKEEKERVKCIVIVATAGTTMTGAFDDVKKINDDIIENENFQRKFQGNIYLHVDAAWAGFVVPFLKDDDKKEIPDFDFRIKNVKSITIDPHKMGLVPYPAGAILFKKWKDDNWKNEKGELLELPIAFITREAEYIGDEKDQTLIGSRPGASAAACWAVFKYLGKDGYRKITEECMRKTRRIISFLNEKEQIEIIGKPPAYTFAFRFKEDYQNKINKNDCFKELLRHIEEKYEICKAKIFRTRKERDKTPEEKKSLPDVYKFVVMPHVTDEAIDSFLLDLQHLINLLK